MLNPNTKAAILAQQDQDIEEAKRWMRGNSGAADHVNAQLIPLWAYITGDFSNPIEDITSRFAMIGIRHVLTLLDEHPAPDR